MYIKAWKQDRNLRDMHIEVLQLMMNESITMIDNMEIDTKFQKAEIKIKIKDLQINKLMEQLKYRDEFIEESRQIMGQADLKDIRDDRIIAIDQILYDNSLFDSSARDERRGGNYVKKSSRINSPGRGGYGPGAYRRAQGGGYVDRQDRID